MSSHLTHRRRGEHGALTPAVMMMAVSLLLLGGLVTDGGRQLNARLRAEATAEEAARAGANMIDLSVADPVLDREAATTAANLFCTQAKSEDPSITDCTVSGFGNDPNKHVDWIEVRVRVKIDATLFGLIGVNTLDAEATERASAVQGITDPGKDVLGPGDDPSIVYPSNPITAATTTNEPPSVVPVPTGYTTELCGVTTVLPTNVGVSCSTTIPTSEPTSPPGPTETSPPGPTGTSAPPTPTEASTVYTTYPTSVSPRF